MRKIITFAVLAGVCLALTSCKKGVGSADDASEASSGAAVAVVELHPCDVTGTQLTVEDCDAAGRWLAESKRGTAAFNAPARMFQGQTKVVTLAVGTEAPPPSVPAASDPVSAASDTPASSANSAPESSAPPAPPRAEIPKADDGGPKPHDVAEEAAPQGTVVDYYPFVGRQMAADLEGEGFDITALSPRVQPVVDGAVTTWSWKVTAREYGQKPLIMKTTVVMTDSRGKIQPLKPTSDPKIVNVIIGPAGVMQWLETGTNWLKTLAAFLAAVAAAIAAWKVLKPKRGG